MPIDQPSIEYIMHPKHIKSDVKKDIADSFPELISKSVLAIKKWCDIPDTTSKMSQKQQLLSLDIHNLVLDIIATIGMLDTKVPLVSVAATIAIPTLAKLDSIKMVCRLLALLQHTGFFQIQTHQRGMLHERYIINHLTFNDTLSKRIKLSCYLPPLIEQPKPILNNFQSGYLTINDSVILGDKENSHHHSLALDTLNTLNQNRYELDEYIISHYQKQWHKDELDEDEFSLLTVDEQHQYLIDKGNFVKYQEQFDTLTPMLVGKTLYFNHKYDKRGRIYVQGYHYSPQGSSFEKACLNLAHKEIITGEL